MNGMVFKELQKYVEARLGAGAWQAIHKDAGLPSKPYLATDHYKDDEAVALIGAAAGRAGKDASELLEDFGAFIAPDLIRIYRSLIPPGWSALDLIEHTELTIHRAVRLQTPTAEPPELKSCRVSAGEVVVTYTSRRRLCAFARGIISGVAQHYKERLAIVETTCMLRGGEACTITVRRV